VAKIPGPASPRRPSRSGPRRALAKSSRTLPPLTPNFVTGYDLEYNTNRTCPVRTATTTLPVLGQSRTRNHPTPPRIPDPRPARPQLGRRRPAARLDGRPSHPFVGTRRSARASRTWTPADRRRRAAHRQRMLTGVGTTTGLDYRAPLETPKLGAQPYSYHQEAATPSAAPTSSVSPASTSLRAGADLYFLPLLKFLAPGAPAVPGYAKLRKRNSWDNRVRDELCRSQERSGINISDLSGRVKAGWHPRVPLERPREEPTRLQRRRRTQPPLLPGRSSTGRPRPDALLQNDRTKAIYDLIHGEPGVIQQNLAEPPGSADPPRSARAPPRGCGLVGRVRPAAHPLLRQPAGAVPKAPDPRKPWKSSRLSIDFRWIHPPLRSTRASNRCDAAESGHPGYGRGR